MGFRYQTRQIAQGYEVTGYIRNLADGRVLMEVEGTQVETDAFLGQIEEELGYYRNKIEKKTSLQLQDFSGFNIV